MELTLYAMNRYDPTRTIVLRNSFARRFRVQFRNLATAVRRAIVDNGMLNTAQSPSAKVTMFTDWLERQLGSGLSDAFLTRRAGGIAIGSWTNMYIQSAYQRGVIRARQEMRNRGYNVPMIEESGGIAAVFSQPFHLAMLDLLYARVNNELKGITAALSQQSGRILSQALIEGRSNIEIARLLTSTILGPLPTVSGIGRFMSAKQRADILARTEIVRAYHAGVIQEYRSWNVAKVNVEAEWRTAGDDRVCDLCAPLEGKTFTLDEIESMIPLHPSCRCVAIPLRVH